jgi:hypothetical protein
VYVGIDQPIGVGLAHAVEENAISYPLELVTYPPLPVTFKPVCVGQALPFPNVVLAHTNTVKLACVAGI